MQVTRMVLPMKLRGRMQRGMVADITIFDPEKVTDHATYKMGEQGLPTTGIPYVIVSGKMVVKDSKFHMILAGYSRSASRWRKRAGLCPPASRSGSRPTPFP